MNLLFLFTYGWIVVRGIHFINFTFLLVSICTWASKHNLLSIASSEKQAILGSDSLKKKGLKPVRWIITCFSPLPWKEAEADSDTGILPPTQKHCPQCLCFTLKLRESWTGSAVWYLDVTIRLFAINVWYCTYHMVFISGVGLWSSFSTLLCEWCKRVLLTSELLF